MWIEVAGIRRFATSPASFSSERTMAPTKLHNDVKDATRCLRLPTKPAGSLRFPASGSNGFGGTYTDRSTRIETNTQQDVRFLKGTSVCDLSVGSVGFESMTKWRPASSSTGPDGIGSESACRPPIFKIAKLVVDSHKVEHRPRISEGLVESQREQVP